WVMVVAQYIREGPERLTAASSRRPSGAADPDDSLMTIHWLDWGAEAFARSRAESKPLLLSLTARWCHACHRMDEETGADPGVAAAVERAAVPVKVDAAARPVLYGRYHLGGLPTTELLTPDGDFVRGGTFLSPPQFFAFLDAALADFRAGRRPAPRATP